MASNNVGLASESTTARDDVFDFSSGRGFACGPNHMSVKDKLDAVARSL